MSVKELKEKAATTKAAAPKATKPAAAPAAPEAAIPIDRSEFAAILTELRKPVSKDLIRQREGWRDRNGDPQMVDYVEWHTVADILDDTCPDWCHRITDIRTVGDGGLAVVVELEIAGVTRQGMGVGAVDNAMGVKKAEHDALKRAAVKFGIARELYHKESREEEAQGEYQARQPYSGGGGGGNFVQRAANANQQHTGGGQYPQQQGFPADPVAKSLSDMVTTKQLGMIRAVAREANVDADTECMELAGCRVSELNRRAASALIDHLREVQPKPPQQLINTTRILLNNLSIPEADAAADASSGREKTLDRLTVEELTNLKNELETA